MKISTVLWVAVVAAGVWETSAWGKSTLRVLTYDSIAAKSGLGPVLLEQWAVLRSQKGVQCDLELVNAGSSGQMLARLALEERKATKNIQIVLGLDQEAAALAQSKGWLAQWGSWRPLHWEKLNAQVKHGSPDLLPLDYGFMALMRRDEAGKGVREISIRDLGTDSFKGQWVLEDPRSSSLGMAFVRTLFETSQASSAEGTDTKARFFTEWNKLKKTWLTLAPGWSEAYGLFLKKKVAWVWSFTTSEAYHRAQGEPQYQAVLFKEGNPLYVDYAAILKGAVAQDPGLALCGRSFLSLLLSSEVQSRIPSLQWMYPAVDGSLTGVGKDATLKAHFEALPVPKKILGSTQKNQIQLHELF